MSELGPSARSLIDVVRGEHDLDAAKHARLRGAFAARVGAGVFAASTAAAAKASALGVAAGGGAAATATSAGGTLLMKGLAVLALVGAGAAGVYTFTDRDDGATRGAVAVVQPIEPSGRGETAAVDTTTTARSSPSSATSGDMAKTSMPVDDSKTTKPVSGHSSRKVTAPAAPDKSASNGAQLRREIELVGEAQRAIRDGDPAKALKLVDDDVARHPSAQLAEERAAARVLALCELHRPEAPAQAATFLRAHPNSPLANRVRKVCSSH